MLTQVLTNKRLCANLLLAATLLVLPGCAGAPWEKRFWNPPAPSGVEPITGQAYPIQRASGENLPQEWPNLADVPEREVNPLPANAAAAQIRQLEADRAAGTARARAAGAAAGAAYTSPLGISVPPQAPSPPPEL